MLNSVKTIGKVTFKKMNYIILAHLISCYKSKIVNLKSNELFNLLQKLIFDKSILYKLIIQNANKDKKSISDMTIAQRHLI